MIHMTCGSYNNGIVLFCMLIISHPVNTISVKRVVGWDYPSLIKRFICADHMLILDLDGEYKCFNF